MLLFLLVFVEVAVVVVGLEVIGALWKSSKSSIVPSLLLSRRCVHAYHITYR